MLSITKERVIKIITHSVLMLVLYILQTAVFARFKIWGVSPVIIPLAVVCIGLFEDAVWSGIWGMAAGILCDCAMGHYSVLFTVLLTVIGFFTAFLTEFYMARGFPTYLFLCLITIALTAFLQMFKFLVFDGLDIMTLLYPAIFQSLYTAIFIIPVYYSVRRLARRR